jgi:hypothetical protein
MLLLQISYYYILVLFFHLRPNRMFFRLKIYASFIQICVLHARPSTVMLCEMHDLWSSFFITRKQFLGYRKTAVDWIGSQSGVSHWRFLGLLGYDSVRLAELHRQFTGTLPLFSLCISLCCTAVIQQNSHQYNIYSHSISIERSTRWRSWLRHCATS